MKSKYLEAFQAIETQCGELHELIGDGMYVEEVPEEEVKTKSGIVMASEVGLVKEGFLESKPKQVIVLAVGKGFYNEETKEDVPLYVDPGDVITVPNMSVQWFNIFLGAVCAGNQRIGLVRECELKHRFKGIDAYEKISEVFRASIEHGQNEQLSRSRT